MIEFPRQLTKNQTTALLNGKSKEEDRENTNKLLQYSPTINYKAHKTICSCSGNKSYNIWIYIPSNNNHKKKQQLEKSGIPGKLKDKSPLFDSKGSEGHRTK